jgi:hypothetical protein
MSFKINISTTWNWAPGFGYISADVSFYFDGTNFYNATTTITSATGDARGTLGIGQPVVANGYVAIPIFCVNSNSIFAKFEGSPSFDYSVVSWGSWESVAYPGAAVVSVPGAITVGGTLSGSNIIVGTNGTANSFGAASTGKLYFGSIGGDSSQYYNIATNMEDFGGNYTKLDFSWFTGQRFYTHYLYGGSRFKEIVTGATLFSVNEGDANVRVTNNLLVGGSATIAYSGLSGDFGAG